MKNNHIADM